MRKDLPAYPAYKDSEVEWIGEVPERWDRRKFTRHIYIQEGQVDPRQEPYLSMVLIAPNHIESKTGKLLGQETASDQGAISGKYLCRAGDVIYSKIRPALAKATIAPSACLCSADMYPFRPRDSYDARYLSWLLISTDFTAWAVLAADRVAMPKLNRETLSELRLPCPPLSDQQAIVTFLDQETAKIDRLKDVRRRQIEVLREQRAAVIHHAVTQGLNPDAPKKDSGIPWLGEVPEQWEVRKIRFLGRFRGGGTPTKDNMAYWDGDIPWVSPKDMKSFFVRDSEDHITEQGLRESSTSLIPSGCLLMVVRSGILRRTIPVAINTREVSLNQDMKAFLPSPGLCASYLLNLIHSNAQALLVLWRKQGATVESLEDSFITNTSIPIPPTTEQEAIVAHIDEEMATIDALIGKYDRELGLLDEYRASLISHAVTGKIDVRGLVDSPAD